MIFPNWPASYITLGILILGVIIFLIARKVRRDYFFETLKLRTLLVKIPQREPNPEMKSEPLKEINFMSQLLSELAAVKIPFGLEVAVHHIGEEIHFYLAVPLNSMEFAMRQVQGLWGDASLELVEDYNIFNPDGISEAVYLKQKESYIIPIRTYDEAGVDTFAPILSTLSKMNEVGEGAALQVLVRPAAKSFTKAATGVVRRLKKGAKLEDAIRGTNAMITWKDIKEALKGSKKDTVETTKPMLDDEAVKTIEKKLARPVFAVNVRLVVSSASKERTEELLRSFTNSFNQFAAPLRNNFRIIKAKNQKRLIFQYIFRQFDFRQQMTLGSDEVASLMHFPTTTTFEIPRLKLLKAREAPPPAELPKVGTLIGNSVFRGSEQPVYITDEDRRRHVYIIGQTGTGKTTFVIANMIKSDIDRGRGVGVIDPHGDLIDLILGFIPPERSEDVIIFDPGDLEKPLGLNMLEYDFSRPEEKTFIVNEMQSIFNRLFPPETMGPMFEQYMRNALLLLMEDAPNEPATLMDVPRIFTDADFRQKKLGRCQNPVIKDFWEREAIMVGGEASLQNITPYITSKFNNFIANDYVRPIISQPKSALRFREIMDNGKILLVNLSKGRIGEINANLLGMIIVGKLAMAAFSRVDLSQEQRKDFNLYIDEFQNFTTDSISIILSEARKYRLNLVIAHQFIAQLQDKIRDAVFGNVGSLITLRVGSKDAEELEKQLAPVFDRNDLINLDNFNAYIKLLINGQTSKPFNIRALPPPAGSPETRRALRELSRNKYGLNRNA